METFVYFIAVPETGKVKIGFSRQPQKRLACLRTGAGTPLLFLGVMKGAITLERSWHKFFASKRCHGEWFTLDEELLAAIDVAVNCPPELLDRLEPLFAEDDCLTEDIAETIEAIKSGAPDFEPVILSSPFDGIAR